MSENVGFDPRGRRGNILVPKHAFLSVICRDDTKSVCCPLDRDVNWRPCGESPPVLVEESHIQIYSRTSVCGRTYLGVVYRKDRIYVKNKKALPALPNFFGVRTLNTHIFLFCPTKHAKHFEKMAELTYAELTQGRESTRLPHTHRFTSLKNVVISALHKIDKRIHIQA